MDSHSRLHLQETRQTMYAYFWDGTLETIDEAGSGAKIVLAVVPGVGNLGVNPVELDDIHPDVGTEAGGDAPARAHPPGAPVDGELEVHILLCPPPEELGVGDLTALSAPSGAE